MPTLKEEQLAQSFARPVEDLTSPFKPVRRLVAAATDILRRRKNPFLVGGLDEAKLNPTIANPENPENPEEKIPNPDFDQNAVMALTRPIAEIIILITCEEDTLISSMSDFTVLERETNRLLVHYSDTEIMEQLPAVMESIESISGSSVEVESSEGDDISLDPEKKPLPAQTG